MKKEELLEETEMNFGKDLSIDESALDVEFLDQAGLVFTYGNMAAKYEQLYNKQKEKINVVKAELDKEIRSDPEKFGLEKLTENIVANTILLQEEYQKETNALIDIKYNWDMAKNAVWALNDKKSALENLVRLHNANYFAGPTVPRNLSEEYEKKGSETNKKIKISTNTKRRRERAK